jgi:hypothetical protein
LCNVEQPGRRRTKIIEPLPKLATANPGPVWAQHQERSIIMPLLQVALSLIVVGVLLWLVNTFIPMARSIKSILNAVVVIVVVVWLLNAFGLLNSIQHLRVGRG